MITNIITFITVFIAVFTSLSLIRVVGNFIRALLSNPPQKFEISDKSLVYYGFCVSYLITLLIISL